MEPNSETDNTHMLDHVRGTLTKWEKGLVAMTNKPDDTALPTSAGTAAGQSSAGRISSPASTGGAGTFFEQHVNAYWLAQLLVHGIVPILHDCVLVDVHLQTEHLGWNTDDFLIIGQNGAGNRRKLAGQVKRTFTVSATDEECKKAIQDFWKDFKNQQQFSLDTDRLALVTLRGTNSLLKELSGLLDCSRIARDGDEFERLLATPGFLSARAIQYCNEIRTIVGESEGQSLTAADIWSFLRVFHVLSLDLNTSTHQTEAMIKTLLAHTTSEQDALGVAEATWDALLRVVSEGMPAARSFRWDDLPEPLRQRHSPVGGTEQRALRALRDHSSLVLESILSRIGTDLHLSRDRLVQEVIEKLESTQLVMVSGPAGSGKSGIAKDVVGILAADHFAFSFRAEEFASPHFDETLHRSQIPSSARMLGAILAGQGRKVLLVESVERLLEASTRDAFADLLTLVAKDPSWRLILTCRDYSTDLVRTGLLEVARVGHSVVTVPPLDDEELQQVQATYPILTHPLSSATLRRLLRNPYVLDKALQIEWSDARPLPVSEREFRARFWQEIVRAEHRLAQGMPRRREEAFIQVALRRARSLTLYAVCADLDAAVVDSLRHDSLIVSSQQNRVLMAPAHDVLEDWAVFQWIDEQYATLDGSVGALSSVLGTFPAVRRTYRKWVSELVERDPVSADRVFQGVVQESGLPAQFRDDSLVSLLRSPAAVAFLERHSAELFANDKQLLRRVIHLLRVACVTTPTWLETASTRPSLFNVPEGPVWACVLRLVESHLESFTHGDRKLLLALIEDWARGVSWKVPYPDGAESVAAIAYWLLPGFDNYRSEDQLERTLQVIAKIPKADRERFAALLQGNLDEEQNRVAEKFQEIIFEGTHGMPGARDMPDAFVSALKTFLLCSEADLQERQGYEYDLELETLFGIKDGRSHSFFPASAYHGPFLPLLRHHPRLGLDFIISVFNHSADWYAHPRVREQCVEPPFEITLTFGDGASRQQWCNARLWNLYRGTSVGPNVLQSLLMALEHWLLDYAKAYPRGLDEVLLDILRKSDSASLTAVVASVATAFPHVSGETLLVLLGSLECILLDRGRMAGETQAPSKLPLPRLDDRNKVYEEERKEADSLPHRQHDLEIAIANLQFGPLAPRVHQILDRRRTKMRPVEEQDEHDRIWRLALHRMDLRQYSVADDLDDSTIEPRGQPPASDEQQHVYLTLDQPDPDIKDMVDRSAIQLQSVNARLGLMMWGLSVFNYDREKQYDPAQWRDRLQGARTISETVTSAEEYAPGRDGPAFMAAVCARDHWEEISDDERQWCANVICSEVQRTADSWNHLARAKRNSMEGDRPCALVLPLLLGKSLSETNRSRIRQLLVVALTHANDQVRWHTAWGVARYLWEIDREWVLRCVNVLATEAALVQQAADAENNRQYPDRRSVDDIEAEAASIVRQRFFEPDGISPDAYRTLDTTEWPGAEANSRILVILGQAPTQAVSIEAFQRLAITLVQWWDADDDRLRNRGQRRPRRNHETESASSDLLENFLLRTTPEHASEIIAPLVDAIDRHPDKVHWRLLGLLSIEDRQPNTTQFWVVWKLFADKVRCAKWLAAIDEEYSFGRDMISAIFLVTRWKDDVRHWRSLEGHAGHVHALFEDLPASSEVLDSYVRFLYHIGEQSLPQAFIRIAKCLRNGDPRQLMKQGNTVFMLELLLQRYVYGRPLELKGLVDLREAVLFLLDMLVEHGSSAAFRMRDDFVTPVPIT